MAHWVIRMAAWWNTRSMPSMRRATSGRSRISPSTSRTIPDASASREVFPPAADEVVEHDDLGRSGVDELIDDGRADGAGAAGDQAPAVP